MLTRAPLQTLRHPPKPPLSVRVGFVGIRKQFDSTQAGLSEAFAKTLNEISVIVLQLQDNYRDCYEAAPHKIFVSGLASGADQFAANLAHQADFHLHTVLAYPRERYVQENFLEDPAGAAIFDQLISKPGGHVLELDGESNGVDGSYDVAGDVLVAHSDILLAIRDENQQGKPGGTDDSIRKALSVGLPVVVFYANSNREPDLLYESRSLRPEELRILLPSLLTYGVGGSQNAAVTSVDADFDPLREEKSLAKFYAEREWRINFGLPYAMLVATIGTDWPKKLSWRSAKYMDQAKENWAPIPGAKCEDNAGKYFRDYDAWPDSLAVYYGHCVRGVVATSIVAGGLVVSLELASSLWENPKLKAIADDWKLAPFLLGMLVLMSGYWQIKRRWMEYRMLSELLRNHALASAIGGLTLDKHRFHNRHGFARSWVLFEYQAIVRNLGVCPSILSVEYLIDFRTLLETRLQSQIEYHATQEKRCSCMHRRIVRLGAFTYSFTVLAIAIPWIYHLLAERMGWPQYQPTVESALRSIDYLGFVFGILSAAIAGFAAQENFSRLAQVSGNMRLRLGRLRERVIDSKPSSSLLRALVGEAIDITIEEHANWVLLSKLRDIEFPAG